MRTATHKIYTINELPESVKAEVLDKYREINTEDMDWWDFTHCDFIEQMSFKGYTIGNILFDLHGCSSSFDGTVDVIDYLRAHKLLSKYPNLVRYIRTGGHNTINLNSSGCYSLEVDGCDLYTEIGCSETPAPRTEQELDDLVTLIETDVKVLSNDLIKQLEQEYDYLESDQGVYDTIETSDYEFYADGTRYNQ